MHPRIYEVPGVHCEHCKKAIENEVGGLSGVDEVVVDIEDRTVTVDGIAGDAEIENAINEAGYEVTASGPATDGPRGTGPGTTGPGPGDAPAPG